MAPFTSMRIGEIKNIIGRVLAENRVIQIISEPLYGGQAYRINNFAELMDALDILSGQTWNNIDYQPVENIKESHPAVNPTLLTAEEFNQLNSYISSINSTVPLYYSMLESLTEPQDEKVINIQLPPNINSLDDLSTTNERLDDILKRFNVDGEFRFVGFDKGTDWYVVAAIGWLSYRFLIACLKIAQECLKTRTEYFNSEQAKISYKASLVGLQDVEENFENYKENWLVLFIESKVQEAIKAIGTHGQTEPELSSKLVNAVKKLIVELGKGTEFHLSLNPPDYAKEQGGQLVIDYKKLQALKPSKEAKAKELNGVTEDKTPKNKIIPPKDNPQV